MTLEQCAECGFDSSSWTDDEALAALEDLPRRWRRAIDQVDRDELLRRPIPDMWSIGEYTDHVRETAFAMRFVIDVAVSDPGSDLGEPPGPAFDPEPRPIAVDAALDGFESEIRALCDRLREIPTATWDSSVIIRSDRVDLHWVARHALHDVTHHLGDLERLRAALG